MASNPPFKTHELLKTPKIAHGFFGRKGGVSKTIKDGQYSSLNVGRGSNDTPALIDENRRRVAQTFNTPASHLLSLWQYHSTEVVTVTKDFLENPDRQDRPKADGHVTQLPNIALTALGADCGPVLFYDPKSATIGACHAGWRGAVAGITDNTIEAMTALGAKRENIRAVLGPCISQKNYEVGAEFEAQLIQLDAEYARFFHTPLQDPSTRQKQTGNQPKAHFDLKAFTLSRLKQAGLTQVAALTDCTYAKPEEYFSFRYNTHHKLGDYGRNISVIMLTE